MKKVSNKNYIYVIILLVITIFSVLFLSNLYMYKTKLTSDFYQYSNIITSEEFNEFIFENPDSIIYISDKYDLRYENFETDLKNKIEALNIKNNFVYLDKQYINKAFIEQLKKDYKIKLEYNKKPIILFIINKEIIKVIEIEINTDVETLIDYEVFE